MSVGQTVQIAIIVVVAGIVCAVVIVLSVIGYRHRMRKKSLTTPALAAEAQLELQTLDSAKRPVMVATDSEENSAEKDLGTGTCQLCGSDCGAEGPSCAESEAIGRLLDSPVRGEICITTADVGVRSTTACSIFFISGQGGGGIGTGGDGGVVGGSVGGRSGSGHFSCVAALPGRDYRTWHCKPERHTLIGGASSGQMLLHSGERLCPDCRPMLWFQLLPDEIVFHQPDSVGAAVGFEAESAGAPAAGSIEDSTFGSTGSNAVGSTAGRTIAGSSGVPAAGTAGGYAEGFAGAFNGCGPAGGPARVASDGADNVWMAVFVEEPLTAGTGGQRRQLAYCGLLSGLQRLPYAGGKLSIKFGADFNNNHQQAAVLKQVGTDLALTDTGSSSEEADLGCDLPDGQRELGSRRFDTRSEFKFTLQAGLAVPLSQTSASNEIFENENAGEDDFTDCDSCSATMSARTGNSPLTYNTRRGAASAKWAAIGMREVASVIESSSPEDQQQPRDCRQNSAGGVAAGIGSGDGCPASQAVSETVAAAAATTITTAAADPEADYLRFLYSDTYSASDSVGDADSQASRSRSVSRSEAAACPSRSPNFYSPDSNVTSVVGGLSAVGSGSSQSEAPND